MEKTASLWSSVRLSSSLGLTYTSRMIAVIALCMSRHNLIVLSFLDTGTMGLTQLVGPVARSMISSLSKHSNSAVMACLV